MTKNTLHRISNDSGVTFIELLVALSLVSLLTVFIISANLFVNRVLSDWRDNNAIYEDGWFIISRLSDDIKSCRAVARSDSMSYAIIINEADTVLYQMAEGKLHRNGIILNSPGVICDSLELTKSSFEKSTPDSILINGLSSYQDELINIKIHLSYKKLTESFETCVRHQNANHIY